MDLRNVCEVARMQCFPLLRVLENDYIVSIMSLNYNLCHDALRDAVRKFCPH